jgi:hypothetical protein
MKKGLTERVGHLRSERTEDEMGEGYGGKGVRSGGGELAGTAPGRMDINDD